MCTIWISLGIKASAKINRIIKADDLFYPYSIASNYFLSVANHFLSHDASEQWLEPYDVAALAGLVGLCPATAGAKAGAGDAAEALSVFLVWAPRWVTTHSSSSAVRSGGLQLSGSPGEGGLEERSCYQA